MMNNTILAFTCVILKIHFLDTQPLICFCLSRRVCMFCFRFAHVRHTCQWPVLVWGSACVQIRKCRQLCLHVSPVPCVISVCVRSEGKFKERRMCVCCFFPLHWQWGGVSQTVTPMKNELPVHLQTPGSPHLMKCVYKIRVLRKRICSKWNTTIYWILCRIYSVNCKNYVLMN